MQLTNLASGYSGIKVDVAKHTIYLSKYVLVPDVALVDLPGFYQRHQVALAEMLQQKFNLQAVVTVVPKADHQLIPAIYGDRNAGYIRSVVVNISFAADANITADMLSAIATAQTNVAGGLSDSKLGKFREGKRYYGDDADQIVQAPKHANWRRTAKKCLMATSGITFSIFEACQTQQGRAELQQNLDRVIEAGMNHPVTQMTARILNR